MDLNSTKEAAVLSLIDIYNTFNSSVPQELRIFINLGFYILFILLYALFVWKFHKFISKKDIFVLNLEKYKNEEHEIFGPIIGALLFILEFLIVFPLVVFFWFATFSLFVLFLSKGNDLGLILTITAGIVGAIRVTAYISEDLSKDIAKLFPFTLLAVFLANPNFFSVTEFIDTISSIPLFITHIIIYLVFIFVLEIVVRLIYTIITVINSEGIIESKK